MFKKNVSVSGFPFTLIDKSNGSVVTSGTITAYTTRDGGAQSALASAPGHKANGQWIASLSASEMNGDIVGLFFTNVIAIPAHFTIKTVAVDPADTVRFGLTALPSFSPGADNGLTRVTDILTSQIAYGALKAGVSGRLLDVSATGEAGIDWSNVGSPTTTVNLSNTTTSGVNSITGSTFPSVADIWSSTLATKPSGIWGHTSRTLTSAGAGGATAVEVWTYGDRGLTDKTGFSIAGVKTTLDALNDASAPTIANAVLTSGISNFEGTATARSLTGAISKLTNRVARTADTTLTIYKTDDSSTMFTQTLTTSGAAPIMSADTN